MFIVVAFARGSQRQNCDHHVVSVLVQLRHRGSCSWFGSTGAPGECSRDHSGFTAFFWRFPERSHCRCWGLPRDCPECPHGIQGRQFYSVRLCRWNGAFQERRLEHGILPHPSGAQPATLEWADGCADEWQHRSAAEYLVFLIQLRSRAAILGQPSIGVLNTSEFVYTLEDGSLFGVTAARLQEIDGKAFPERVTPNIISPDDLNKLAQSQDVLLESAVDRLLNP
jgi:Peptidase family S41